MKKNAMAPKVIERTRTIEVSKVFHKAAQRFGTEEYRMLQEVRRDYPGYAVAVRQVKSANRGAAHELTYKRMEDYIKKHDETGAIKKEFDTLRGKTEESAFYGAATHEEVEEWFLATYPEVAGFEKKRKALLNQKKKQALQYLLQR